MESPGVMGEMEKGSRGRAGRERKKERGRRMEWGKGDGEGMV